MYNAKTTGTYPYDVATKLSSIGTKNYSYAAGNCTSVYNSATGDTVSMTYDAESRMVSASDSASTFSDTYSYSGLDQRVGKVDNGWTFYTRDLLSMLVRPVLSIHTVVLKCRRAGQRSCQERQGMRRRLR